MPSSFSNIPPSAKRFIGFAEAYDKYRPAPPEALGTILTGLLQVGVPRLVIDLGCGTGLSTRFWAERAVQVIGVDASMDMLQQAKAQTPFPNVSYHLGVGHHTGILPGRADLVTCSQALHWMEPEPTLAEVARLLRPGGVFAAYDHDFYPILPHWEAELAYRAFRQRAIPSDDRYEMASQVGKWPKAEHLSRMQQSGHFRYTREFTLHQEVMGNAERLIGLNLTYGFVQSLLRAGISESELGLDTFASEAHRILGDQLRPWYWSTQVRVGLV